MSRQPRRGGPMSTENTLGSSRRQGSRPAAVSTSASFRSCPRRRYQAMQRVPLPQAADRVPSMLRMSTKASVPGVRGGSMAINWSKCRPGCIPSRRADALDTCAPAPRRSTTRIALPMPFILAKGTDVIPVPCASGIGRRSFRDPFNTASPSGRAQTAWAKGSRPVREGLKVIGQLSPAPPKRMDRPNDLDFHGLLL